MKKALPKLALRKQALRALSGMDLGRAVGGQDADAVPMGITGDTMCAVAAVLKG